MGTHMHTHVSMEKNFRKQAQTHSASCGLVPSFKMILFGIKETGTFNFTFLPLTIIEGCHIIFHLLDVLN